MVKKSELVTLLIEARKFDNETVRDAGAMALWRLKVDRALKGCDGDRAEDRYDYPPRREHRQFVQRVLHHG